MIMSGNRILSSFRNATANNEKKFAVLIDPDKQYPEALLDLSALCAEAAVDYIFIGGSLMSSNHLSESILAIKAACNIPVIIFPGSANQICPEADAIFLLSLISGRNPDLLIGKHVEAAPALKSSGLEVISTGYLLVDGGKPTTASYISNTTPIPEDKPDIAACTALAGAYLGHKVIYLDAGSGAMYSPSPEMIRAVKNEVSLPLIVGGGITNIKKARDICKAGADIVVVGNAIEKDSQNILKLSSAIHSFNSLTI